MIVIVITCFWLCLSFFRSLIWWVPTRLRSEVGMLRIAKPNGRDARYIHLFLNLLVTNDWIDRLRTSHLRLLLLRILVVLLGWGRNIIMRSGWKRRLLLISNKMRVFIVNNSYSWSFNIRIPWPFMIAWIVVITLLSIRCSTAIDNSYFVLVLSLIVILEESIGLREVLSFREGVRSIVATWVLLET